jgi:hypothetical protein
MRRNIVLRLFLQIPTKCRFTKVFSIFSTVFVDNFVENEPVMSLPALDKLYLPVNIA